MTSVGDKAGSSRRRDARASRQALLDAATELFDARGYAATTTREIGEAAGVDTALIARYFGSKEGLYLATVAAAERPAPDGDPHAFTDHVLRRSETRGLGPVAHGMVSPASTGAMRAQISEMMAARNVEPMAAALAARGAGDARLRAELVVAMALGISLMRAGGTLPALRDAQVAELRALLSPAIDALCGTAGEEPAR